MSPILLLWASNVPTYTIHVTPAASAKLPWRSLDSADHPPSAEHTASQRARRTTPASSKHPCQSAFPAPVLREGHDESRAIACIIAAFCMLCKRRTQRRRELYKYKGLLGTTRCSGKAVERAVKGPRKGSRKAVERPWKGKGKAVTKPKGKLPGRAPGPRPC